MAVDMEGFQNPPISFRGTELWMLNSRLEEGELERQIREMSEKGFYSFIARTYIGLESDYPGEDFMGKMGVIVDAARRYNMKVFLQAIYMPEAVLDLPEEYSLKNIVVNREGEEAKGRLLSSSGGLEFRSVSTGTFLDMMSADAMQFYLRQSYEEKWLPFAGEFGKTILSVWVDEPSYNGGALPWNDGIPRRFREKWGYSLEEQVHLLYLDGDGAETVRYHYWRIVLALLKEAYFTEVRDWCHSHNLLFSGHLMTEDTLAAQMSRACCAMPFYKYFDIPGVDYLMAEMDWRHNSLPPRVREPHRKYNMINTPLQCVSAAHQAGKEDILCEMYGVSSQGLNFRDQKSMFDHFASLGINHKCVHGVFYSLKGRGKRAYPPHINYYQPYWEEYRTVTDYCARASWFISQGKPVRDILVVHPMDSAFCEYHGPWEHAVPNRDLNRRDMEFHDLLLALLAGQHSFALGDEDTMAEWGAVEGDRFRVGEMAYQVLVLPDLANIRSATLQLAEAFAAQGGKVIVMGRLPALLDGWPGRGAAERVAALPGAAFVENADALDRHLAGLPRPYRLACGRNVSLQVNRRREGETDLFFLYNEDFREARRGSLVVPGEKTAMALRGESGEAAPLAVFYDPAAHETSIAIAVPEGGGIMVAVSPGKAGPVAVTAGEARLPLAPDWSVSRASENVYLLEFCRYRKGDGEYSALYPVLAVQELLAAQDYRGPLTLAFPFEADRPLEGLRLAMEDMEKVTLAFNGKPVALRDDGYYMAADFRVAPLPGSCRAGENLLEVTREFAPLSKPKSSITSLFETLSGVQLEAMYLLGDFAVGCREERTMTNCVRLNRRMVLTAEERGNALELTASGYPFYAGALVLEQEVPVPDTLIGQGTVLRFHGFRACTARVEINGTDAGSASWAPYEVEVGRLLRPGRNRITLRLTNTLRNLLGPYHRPKGEFGECWPGYGMPNLPWLGAAADRSGPLIPHWQDNREPDTAAWTESYLQVSFGFTEAALERKEQFL